MVYINMCNHDCYYNLVIISIPLLCLLAICISIMIIFSNIRKIFYSNTTTLDYSNLQIG